MATRRLAQWATDLTPAGVPASAQAAARRSLYNYLGCAIGGAEHGAVKKAHAALSPFFGPSTASLLGHGGASRADAQHAALLNGIASHVHDYDDTHLATIIHPTGPVASAVLAYVEHAHAVGDAAGERMSGVDVLVALTAGIEASCKVGLAVWPAHYDIGWHITASTGSIGAAVGVGKLMGLTAEQTAHAIGLAAVQVTGLREMFGSDTKSFHPGRAAQAGLLAALLARQGYTSSARALEAPRGWAAVVAGGGVPQLDPHLATLGERWEVEANAFKPFPCGIVCHPAIDAGIQLHQSALGGPGRTPQDIDRVDARVHPLVLELTAKRAPRDSLEAKFSVFHGAAVALLHGRAGPAQYADAVVADPAVVALRDKVDAQADPGLAPDEAVLTVRFADGGVRERHVRHAVGSLEAPMSDEQLTAKFVDQAALVRGEAGARAASEAAWAIGDAAEIGDIVAALRMM